MTHRLDPHPVQVNKRHVQGRAPAVVCMKAYEVYCALYREQPAMVNDGCRGGFSSGELIAFLYAATFPRAEWRVRVDEAFHGMENL